MGKTHWRRIVAERKQKPISNNRPVEIKKAIAKRTRKDGPHPAKRTLGKKNRIRSQ